jgi:hypothetical protein
MFVILKESKSQFSQNTAKQYLTKLREMKEISEAENKRLRRHEI